MYPGPEVTLTSVIQQPNYFHQQGAGDQGPTGCGAKEDTTSSAQVTDDTAADKGAPATENDEFTCSTCLGALLGLVGICLLILAVIAARLYRVCGSVCFGL